jgi:uncharacterized protein
MKNNTMEMNQKKYTCPKCGNKNYEIDEFRAVGGMFSKLFNVQNKKFTTISCTHCGYTDIFKKTTSTAGNIVDFFFN